MAIDKNKIIGSKTELFIKETTLTNVSDGVVIISGYANKYLDENGQLIIDRSDEAVLPQGYDLEDFMKNPILLYAHKKDQPIGKIINVDIRPDGLYVEAEVHKAMNEQVFYGVKNGILKTFSIGFTIQDYMESSGVYLWTATKLFEISIVSIPDNQDSLFSVLTDSPCKTGVCLLGSKAVSNVLTTKEWKQVDKAELKTSIKEINNPDVIKDAYLIVGDVEDVETWKYPHHDLVNKELILNKGGVISAFSALKGAANDDILSVTETLDAATHLLNHFKELKEIGDDVDENISNVEEFIKNLETQMDKTKDNADKTNVENDNTDQPSEQSPENNTINSTEETENGSNQNPDNSGEGQPDSKVVGLDDVVSFIDTAKSTDEGVMQLLELYSTVTETLNEVLANNE